VIAKEEVEVQRLEEQIANCESKLAKDKEQILRLKTDLATTKDTYQYGGRSYTAAEVKTDLANRFERYKTAEATLASLKQVHGARVKSLAAARQKLEGMLAQKRQLQVEVENLEARHQMVAAAQTTSNYQFDDSQLGRAKELVQNLKTRLEVSEKLVNAESDFQGEIPLDKAGPQNIVDQVGDYFGQKKLDAKAVAVTEKK
jgi:chromosome segregation ATPase